MEHTDNHKRAYTSPILVLPVVEWTDILLADDPTRAPSRARLRTLTSKHLVPSGVTVPVREAGRFAGRKKYFSTLWGFAARARRQAEAEIADRLEHEAASIEKRYKHRLEIYLASHSIIQLSEATFFRALSEETADALEKSGVFGTLLIVTGLVSGIGGDTLHVSGFHSHEFVDVSLPASLAKPQGLEVDEPVWVVSRPAGGAAVVEVLPATQLGHGIRQDSALSRSALTGVRTDLASDREEQRQAAARYRDLVAADLDDDFYTELGRDEVTRPIPVRTITLAL
jgi:hypothetical protein